MNDITKISDEWYSLVARLKKEAIDTIGNSKDGISIVTALMLMDSDGNPVAWVVPSGLVLEPKKSGRAILGLLTKIFNKT
jgi:hypothetical protein